MAKRKRMRRAYLKRFSAGYVNTGRFNPSLFEYSQGKVTNIDARLVRIFGLDQETDLVGDRRLKVEQAILALTNAAPVERCICLSKGRYQKTFMYEEPGHYNSNDVGRWKKPYYYFVKYSWIHLEISKSIVYGERERAMFAYQEGEIVWKEVIDLSV